MVWEKHNAGPASLVSGLQLGVGQLGGVGVLCPVCSLARLACICGLA